MGKLKFTYSIIAAFILLSFPQNSFAQIPQLEIILKKLKNDSQWVKKRSSELADYTNTLNSNLSYTTLNKIPLGKPCFTTQTQTVFWSPNLLKNKGNTYALPQSSLVYITDFLPTADSLIYSPQKKMYAVYYQVYIPSLRKTGYISGLALPNFCIATRGYQNQQANYPQPPITQVPAMVYHSQLDDPTRPESAYFFSSNWINDKYLQLEAIHANDWIFQVSYQYLKDSDQLQICTEVGRVVVDSNSPGKPQNWHLEKPFPNVYTPYFYSAIFPKVYNARGLNGIRNVIAIEHWAESCGAEGGTTYLTFDAQLQPSFGNKNGVVDIEQSHGLVKLGDFSSVSDGGVFFYGETLVFPADTLVMGDKNSDFFKRIIGVQDYIIQSTTQFEASAEEIPNSASPFDSLQSLEKIETYFYKWTGNPIEFKKHKAFSVNFEDPIAPENGD